MHHDEELAELARRRTEAERHADVKALDGLRAGDFRAAGPRDFVLDTKQRLDRYASGTLVHDAATRNEVTVRRCGRAAVAVGVQAAEHLRRARRGGSSASPR
jgi:hypothetical protein